MRIDGWRAFYSGNRVFGSGDRQWSDLPSSGILGVVVYFDESPSTSDIPYRQIVCGGDWYYLDDDGTPVCTPTYDGWGEWIYPPDVPPDELKRGVAVRDDEYEQVQADMMEARVWP